MDGVVGTDQEIRADCGKLVCRSKHQLANTLPVSVVNPFHILGKRRRVYRDFGMSMRAENLRAFRADRPVAKRGSFGGTRNDADVLGHTLILGENCVGYHAGVGRSAKLKAAAQSRCVRLTGIGFSSELRFPDASGYRKVSVLRQVSRALCRRLNLGKKDALRYSG